MTGQEELLNKVLNHIALELDIPPHKYKEAMERFGSIKRKLEDSTYPNSTPPPFVYIQGSFRLGTVIRPIKGGKDCGFDLDIVCEVKRKKDDDNPENLKDEVGVEVKSYAKQNGMDAPDNSRRCWALNYAPDSEGIGFHVDVLPCLPDVEAAVRINLANLGMDASDRNYMLTTVAITNRNDDVDPPEYNWRSSNPNGFATWFYNICQPGFAHVDRLREKEFLFEAYGHRQNFPYEQAQDIPDALVRTPLQRAIQIMKRHRDVRFNGRRDEKHKPISMIITTLAAKLYAGRANQYQSTRSVLRFIVETLAQHAALVDNDVLLEDVRQLQLIRRVGDTWYIPNPVNPHNPGDPEDKGENFADRWHEDNHAKAKAFFAWVKWLRDDLDSLLNDNDVSDMGDTLTEAFGDTIASRTLNRLNVDNKPIQPSKMLQASSADLSKFNVAHRQKPKWPINLTHEVTIECTAKQPREQTLHSDNGFRRIAKHYSLEFKARTNVPGFYHVYWQIVNTGHEAQSHGSLRGEITLGFTNHSESTLYKGFHWVECFIVKDGILVARSGEFVVNIE